MSNLPLQPARVSTQKGPQLVSQHLSLVLRLQEETRPTPAAAVREAEIMERGLQEGGGRSQVQGALVLLLRGAGGPVFRVPAPLAARAAGPAGAEDPPRTPSLRVPKLAGAWPETLGPRLSAGGPRQDCHLTDCSAVRGGGRGAEFVLGGRVEG